MNLPVKVVVLLLSLSLIICSSCKKDFLEVIPKGKQIAQTTADYDLLMNGTLFYQYLQGGGWEVPVLMGDEIGAEQSFFVSAQPLVQRLFRWEDVIYQQPTEIANDLRTFLPNIYSCNQIINEVLNSKGGTDQQKRSIRAEAMATRAWVYFQLINFYAKPYHAATAASDPGFPIVLNDDVTQNSFPRGTVQEGYDFMIRDLAAAIPDLPLQNTFRTRMSKPAANALLGKVYLFMGKPDLALPYFNAAFTENAAATSPVRLYDYNLTFGPNGSFLPIGQNGPASPKNIYNDFTESILAKTFSNSDANGSGGSSGPGGPVMSPGGPSGASNGTVITPETADLYGSTDLRLNFYTPTYVDGSPIPGGRLRKYGVSYSKFGVELSELYLLRAECRARLNDLTGAISDVEALRKNRMPEGSKNVPAIVATDQTRLIKFIIDERIREFAGEGYRWFDMRRLSVDPLFTGQIFTHKVYQESGSPIIYTLKQPERLVLKFPLYISEANPGMVNNP